MQNLTLTLVQPETVWENVDANLAALDHRIQGLRTDLLVLPEMFTTGFTMNPEAVAEDMAGAGVRWLRNTAQNTGAVVTGSLVIREGEAFFNRLVWAEPDGSLHTYDKRHLFRMAGEDRVYGAGARRLTVRVKGWKVRPFICYDLRFPAWCRNFGDDYHLALFVANWPAARTPHWRILLQARAVENQSYVVGVNRVGVDGNGLAYDGESAVIDPTGETLLRISHSACTVTLRLDPEVLLQTRKAFPVWMDADRRFAECLP